MDQDIRRFEIPMHDAAAMRFGQCRTGLRQHLRGGMRIQVARRLHHLL